MRNPAGVIVEPIIGLEIHVQLATRTKAFCNCPVVDAAPPNSSTCPVCLGLPGALPVINRRAIELALRAALALNCQVAECTKWDRKSYYYPDLPKNYQISQYEFPLTFGGHFEFLFEGRARRVGIRRAHLEEDAGKNIHDFEGFSGVDLNRAGTPLLEIVSEPDLHSAAQTREFAVQIQRLVRYLGVSGADMQCGHLRFEPNVNLKITRNGREWRTPIVEIKNLNSFRALHGAVSYEISRQLERWQKTAETAGPGNQSNRGWDEQRGVTVPQRDKEAAHDYRYFPDPDLAPVVLDRNWVRQLKAELPELPLCRTERFVCEFKLDLPPAAALVDDRATADLLDDAGDAGGHKPTLARQFLSFWTQHAHERHTTIAALGISPGRLAELANLVHTARINATAAARVAEHMLHSYESPSAIARKLGVLQSQDREQIRRWVNHVLASNQKAVQDALGDPKKRQAARGFLTGQVMTISAAQADPNIVAQVLERRLRELADNA